MTEIKCYRVRRSWIEKLMMWQRAYETRITEGFREICARGPSPEASEQAAQRRWALGQKSLAVLDAHSLDERLTDVGVREGIKQLALARS
jgi:hypothetical protein